MDFLRNNKILAIVIVFFIVFGVVAFLCEPDNYSCNSESEGINERNTYNSYDSLIYDDTSKTENDAATIFNNLSITDFSCSLGKYSGRMSCRVTNNNSFTVNGYFRVNFYDESGVLMYDKLISLADVMSGETITCSTSIPKDDYPTNYSTFDFSQASLVESD